MRKYSLLLLFAVFSVAGLLAQQTHFGFRAGVNSTNASIEVNGGDVDVDGQTNLMLGAFVDLPIGGDLLSLQPEINYLNRGYSSSFNVGAASVKRTVAYLDFGAILKLQFGDREATGFYLGVGPTVSYAVSGKTTTALGESDTDFDAERIKRGGLQFAALGGASFNIGGPKLFLEARYNGSLSNISDDDDVDIRQSSVGVNGGVMVPIGN